LRGHLFAAFGTNYINLPVLLFLTRYPVGDLHRGHASTGVLVEIEFEGEGPFIEVRSNSISGNHIYIRRTIRFGTLQVQKKGQNANANGGFARGYFSSAGFLADPESQNLGGTADAGRDTQFGERCGRIEEFFCHRHRNAWKCGRQLEIRSVS